MHKVTYTYLWIALVNQDITTSSKTAELIHLNKVHPGIIFGIESLWLCGLLSVSALCPSPFLLFFVAQEVTTVGYVGWAPYKLISSWVQTRNRTGRKPSLVAQLVKNPPAMQETLVLFLGQEDPLEKG